MPNRLGQMPAVNSSTGLSLSWVVIRHQYVISTLGVQTSFHKETSGGVTKCQPFSQAIFSFVLYIFLNEVCIKTSEYYLSCFKKPVAHLQVSQASFTDFSLVTWKYYKFFFLFPTCRFSFTFLPFPRSGSIFVNNPIGRIECFSLYFSTPVARSPISRVRIS